MLKCKILVAPVTIYEHDRLFWRLNHEDRRQKRKCVESKGREKLRNMRRKEWKRTQRTRGKTQSRLVRYWTWKQRSSPLTSRLMKRWLSLTTSSFSRPAVWTQTNTDEGQRLLRPSAVPNERRKSQSFSLVSLRLFSCSAPDFGKCFRDCYI